MKNQKKLIRIVALILFISALTYVAQNSQLFFQYFQSIDRQQLNDSQVFIDSTGRQRDPEIRYVTDTQQKLSKTSIIGNVVSVKQVDGEVIVRVNPKPAGAEVSLFFGKNDEIISFRSSKAGVMAEEKVERMSVGDIEKQLQRQVGRMIEFEILADMDPGKEREVRGSCAAAQCALLDTVKKYMDRNFQYARNPQTKKLTIGPVIEVNIGSNR